MPPSPRNRPAARRARPLAVVASLVAVLLTGPTSFARPTTPPTPPPPAPPTVPAALLIEGKGHGHGVGLSQDGALAMGRAGATTTDILGHFYPGTEAGRAGGTVRVEVVAATAPATVVEFPDGGEIRDGPDGSASPGFPVVAGAGGRVELSFDGEVYRARALPGPFSASDAGGAEGILAAQAPTGPRTSSPTTSTTARPTTTPTARRAPRTDPPPAPAEAPPPADAPPSEPPLPVEATSTDGLWAVPGQGSVTAVPARDRRYRGVLRAEAAPGGLRLLNEIDVEDYLRGMGEVRDPGWPAASLRAQAVAARTYALRAVAGVGEICDTDRCQVYLGQGAEYQAMDDAVAATRGHVVTAGGSLAATFYSASGGGFSATPEEGFGGGSDEHPYLVARPYPTDDPRAWIVRAELADLARRFGYAGELGSARVPRAGPSGRALEVSLEGSAGPLSVDGLRFMSELGLRSNLFTLRVEEAPPVVAAPGPVVETVPTLPADPPPAIFEQAADDQPPLGRWWVPATLAAALLLLVPMGLRRGRRTADPVPVAAPAPVVVEPALHDPPRPQRSSWATGAAGVLLLVVMGIRRRR